MDDYDKQIYANELAIPLGKAISQWMRKNNVEEPVIVRATVTDPTCYIDEQGVSHTGRLVTVNVDIAEYIDDDDDDDDDD